MSKIIKFETEKDKRIDNFLNNVKEAIETNKLDTMMFVAKTPDGEIVIGKCNINVATELELISHLQIDAMDMVIKANYVTP